VVTAGKTYVLRGEAYRNVRTC